MTEEEFNEMVRANFSKLVKAAESILYCEEAAKDAVQTTLVKVWKNIATFDPERGTIESLLFISVKRVALDHLKSRKRKLATLERLWGEIIPDRPTDPDPRLPRLMAALKQLPDKKMALIKMVYFDGKSSTAIAEELGLTLPAAKSRIHNTKKTLLRLFRREAA